MPFNQEDLSFVESNVVAFSGTENPSEVVYGILASKFSKMSASELAQKQLDGEISPETMKSLFSLLSSSEKRIYQEALKNALEHIQFDFSFEGISRVASFQLFLLGMNTGGSQQSQRYVNPADCLHVVLPETITDTSESLQIATKSLEEMKEAYKRVRDLYIEFYTSELAQSLSLKEREEAEKKIVKLANEDARYLLFIAAETKMGLFVSARCLYEKLPELLASSHSEIREIARKMLKVVQRRLPGVFDFIKSDEVENVIISDFFDEKSDGDELFVENNVEFVKAHTEMMAHTNDPDASVWACTKQCYSKEGIPFRMQQYYAGEVSPENIAAFWSRIEATGHSSPAEASSAIFRVEGMSIACAHQLLRHRIMGLSLSDIAHGGAHRVVIPPKIAAIPEAKALFESACQKFYENFVSLYQALLKAGYDEETAALEASYILPNAVAIDAVISMNSRAAKNFVGLRTCSRAQWEIRDGIAKPLMKSWKTVAPVVHKKIGPPCIMRGGVCPESKAFSCGKCPTQEELEEKKSQSFKQKIESLKKELEFANRPTKKSV